ncbi:Transcription initiation factor TFIID, subunit TAF5 (also component of histone acetyltransferase SAGA) [Plasmopara halstedii]|uniref:Transcription initiation factor TFIID, subunit TAF5 (Also component of histone acetyltransferase SAGA) n=1 Tax=Plasmopara halstedii TaxID=4781 RepID=A0A0P1AYC2_PLAHL|nr:Transcription initiation factor TFIID, subunit TAF5 (also component of histone acetyltransferase SAGA) [Plasmopara halstedii]CEG45816.1 Transcription initiation factor TFIID, subunit TAF5 (also component of histone acetyltransferase SAGA) [Plasmopara halstedii]|eukprot:XP_024582185.1 Transcription initiation factor TFIID, subunit TAF5 (also component of histone acetyltransferase SAGA) [Plasmopara halstedii]
MDTDATAINSTRDGDALQDVDVTSLPTLQSHVVFRLRRVKDDKAPWIVEVVILLFNAQGDMLQVARGVSPADTTFFGKNNLYVTRAKSKAIDEREVAHFSVAKLHPYVEVVGCLVTYVEDEIVRSPQLNAFSLTCDLQVEDNTQSASIDDEQCTRLLDVCYDPKTVQRQSGKQPNVVILGKFFRRPGPIYQEWAFHAAKTNCCHVVIRSAVTASLVETMQSFLLDLIPDITIPNRNPLTTVAGICAALSCKELEGIKRHFPDDGLSKGDFARLLLWELMRTRPSLMQHFGRATALVGLLFEMFEQIDINGDAMVNWEEFTSFCTALGLLVTQIAQDERNRDEGQSNEDSHNTRPQDLINYRHKALSSGSASRTFPYQINKIKTLSLLKRLAVIEHKSPRILIFDLDMNFLHEFDCGEKLVAEKKGGEKQKEYLDNVEVIDAEYISSRNLLAVVTSDSFVSLWSIIDATAGTYVFNGKLMARFPVLFIKWCPLPLKRLFVAGGLAEHVQLWDLDAILQTGVSTLSLPLLLPRSHTERIAACLDLPESPYIATASFDHTITIWETQPGPEVVLGGPSAVLVVSSVLRGHQQGVLTLDFAQSLLLSSGFEYQAYCWGLSGRVLKTKLGGHHHCLMGARFVSTASNESCLAVTGDQSAHFKLWDLTRCAKGSSGNHLSIMLQTFELHTPNLCRFRMFTTTSNKQPNEPGTQARLESSASDVITGNLRLYRFSAFTPSTRALDDATLDEAAGLAPTRFVVFNAVTNVFVGAVENRITVWNANSGLKTEEPVIIRNTEVCAITFDSPRERKLFVATSDGAIRLYNPVTGALLRKEVVHDGVVTSLVFCSHANCLVSTGEDQKICLLDSPPGKLKLEILHFLEKAHTSSITCCACSMPSPFIQPARFIATGDDAGGVHVYDLHHITFKFRCANVHTREISVLHFASATPGLFISGDVSGNIFMWSTNGVRSSLAQPLLRLKMQELSPLISDPTLEVDGITAVCSTNTNETSHGSKMLYVGVESGQIFAWDLQSLPTNILMEGHAARRLAISQRHSQSEVLGQGFEASIKSAILPVILPIKSWMAHRAGVLSVQSVVYPGEFLSLGVDGVVKIWDDTAACIGHILTTSEQSAASASAWKFIRRDHLIGGDQRQLMEQIAREVMAKHERRLKRELNRQQKLEISPRTKQLDSLNSSLSLMEICSPTNKVPSSTSSQLPTASKDLTNGACALFTQVPFSIASVSSGIRQGLFGVEEARQLRYIAKNSKGLHIGAHAKRKKIAKLAPLLSLGETNRTDAMAKAKVSAVFNKEPQIVDYPSRVLTNFPLELERRAAANARVSATGFHVIDAEPSMFLREKLHDDALLKRKQEKSTQKKRLYPPDRNTRAVTLDRNVSLPKLPQPSHGEELLDCSTLIKPLNFSASDSILATASTPLKLPISSSPEKISRNIERKLNLCQQIEANVSDMKYQGKIVRNKESMKTTSTCMLKTVSE